MTALPEQQQQLPTVRSLGRDLVVVVAFRARARLRRWHVFLRDARHASAEARRCAALVALILLTSLLFAWVAWNTTVEQREGRAAAQPASASGLEGSLVDTDVTRELEKQRGHAPGQGSRGRAPEAPNGAARLNEQPSAVGGYVLSVAAVAAVLAVGVGAAVLVVRRHRRSAGALEAERVLPFAWLPDLADPKEPAADDEVLDVADIDAPTDVGDASDADSSLDLMSAEGPPGTAGPAFSGSSPLWVDSGVAQSLMPSSSTQVLVDAPVPSRIAAQERLYERRSAPRVDYVHPGRLEWRGVHWEMSVRDLSGTGLRLWIAPGEDARLPASNDYVQVDFPVDGGRVHVAAQVAWRRATADGTEIGVVFRPLAVQDVERIRETCLARL